MKRICTICARGGSKGVKNKNIRSINNIPLIGISILQAKKTALFNYIAVSSESEDILKFAKEYGADIIIKRPEEMATDTAAKVPVIRHALVKSEEITGMTFNTHVDLDCTSPLRNTQDIIDAVSMLEKYSVKNIISGTPSRRSPYFNLVELNENGHVVLSKKLPTQIIRRQDAPICFDMNASIYVWNRDAIMNNDSVFLEDTLMYSMPEERSHDIDSELDFDVVSYLASKREDLTVNYFFPQAISIK